MRAQAGSRAQADSLQDRTTVERTSNPPSERGGSFGRIESSASTIDARGSGSGQRACSSATPSAASSATTKERCGCSDPIDPRRNEPTGTEWGAHRDVAIILSLPGVGRIVAATMLAEASQALAERDCHALRNYSGSAPLTRQSGK